MHYRPTHFVIQELVSKVIYTERGEAAWELLDSRLLMSLDAMRGVFGPIIVNNWHTGGGYQLSGFRAPDCTVGARLSQHRFGRAADCKFQNTTPQAVYQHLLDNPGAFPYLTTLEDIIATSGPPAWLHIDVRNNEHDGIRVVNP